MPGPHKITIETATEAMIGKRIFVRVTARVTVLLIPNSSTGYPCYHSLIVGQLFKVFCNCSYTVSFIHYLLISSAGTSFLTYGSS